MYDRTYVCADTALRALFGVIMRTGERRGDTMAIMNAGLHIRRPFDNIIRCHERNWNQDYAEAEWQWYLSKDPDATEIAKRAGLWKDLMDENGHVNSNYGYQWSRGDQLNKVIEMIKKDPLTRRASISLYDGKEMDKYEKDTICTYAINFFVQKGKLNMQVVMRSNDLIYGFCNDQYCFSKLQKLVSIATGYPMGYYFHWAANMHIYERHWSMFKVR